MTTERLADPIGAAIEGRVQRGRELSHHTTYRLGGRAAVYVEPASEGDLEKLARVVGPAGVDVLVLGRGSNVVVSDGGFDGVVIAIGDSFSWVAGDGDWGLRSGAGTALPKLANWTARRGLGGLEFCISIPGSVGGAVRMNAGAHGGEIKDVLVDARVVTLEPFAAGLRTRRDLGYGYRRSVLGPRDVVVEARFELVRRGVADVRDRIESFRLHRAATQPGALQNAGSVFKNPPGDFSGRLVEAAGLKGFAVGGARVSELHANFFIAERGATAQDVYDLVHEVRRRVYDSFGVELEPEIRFVGPFRSPSGEIEVRTG